MEWIFKVCHFHKSFWIHVESLQSLYPQVILSFWPKTLIINWWSKYTYWLLHSCLHAQQDIWWHVLGTRNFSWRIPTARESWLLDFISRKSSFGWFQHEIYLTRSQIKRTGKVALDWCPVRRSFCNIIFMNKFSIPSPPICMHPISFQLNLIQLNFNLIVELNQYI